MGGASLCDPQSIISRRDVGVNPAVSLRGAESCPTCTTLDNVKWPLACLLDHNTCWGPVQQKQTYLTHKSLRRESNLWPSCCEATDKKTSQKQSTGSLNSLLISPPWGLGDWNRVWAPAFSNNNIFFKLATTYCIQCPTWPIGGVSSAAPSQQVGLITKGKKINKRKKNGGRFWKMNRVACQGSRWIINFRRLRYDNGFCCGRQRYLKVKAWQIYRLYYLFLFHPRPPPLSWKLEIRPWEPLITGWAPLQRKK